MTLCALIKNKEALNLIVKKNKQLILLIFRYSHWRYNA